MTDRESTDEQSETEESAVSHPSPPATESDDPTFAAPWQARAFALTVALRREDDFPWAAFQQRLVEELDEDPERDVDAEDVADVESAYYRAWLAALERLLLEADVIDDAELAERVAAFASGERDASEFVVGDHGHAHDHGHGE